VDEDERLSDDYAEMINNAYANLPDASFIAFNINRIGWHESEKIFDKPERIGRFKTYSSVHITFRRNDIVENNIKFNEEFGAGSGMYICAEDAIFCMDCHKARLNMYTHPGLLCEVNCETSTWFTGHDEKYFYNVGAYLAATFPVLKVAFKWYYPIRCRKNSELNAFKIIFSINRGIKGYKKRLNYQQYCEKFNK
jgi:hypothetical protein